MTKLNKIILCMVTATVLLSVAACMTQKTSSHSYQYFFNKHTSGFLLWRISLYTAAFLLWPWLVRWIGNNEGWSDDIILWLCQQRYYLIFLFVSIEVLFVNNLIGNLFLHF